MNVTSTVIHNPPPAYAQLPDNDPAEPTLMLAENGGPGFEYLSSAIVSGPQFSRTAPSNRALQDVMEHDALGMIRLASDALTNAMPDSLAYVVRGTWVVLDVTHKSLNLWDKFQLSPDDMQKAENAYAVPIAALDLGAQLLGGVGLARRAMAGFDTNGVRLPSHLSDIAGHAKLLVKATKKGVEGGDVNDVFIQDYLGQNPVYGYATGILGAVDKLGRDTPNKLVPSQMIFAPTAKGQN